ncbi:VanW family protein [Pseudonocardia acaciae]|uniref:VanW family protein n=1 Tax=Pseudonocardia acaciae TaxID=551276 RepID=UPI000685F489|nr:VanW family protein [Pseudonocardia acaciae]
MLAAVALAYGIDLLTSRDQVPRGVIVSGIEIGGMTRADAEQTLRDTIQPGLHRDIPIRAGAVHTSLSPASAGLAVDWAGTVAATGDQPLNPIKRVTSLFTTEDRDVVTNADDTALTEGLDGINTQVHRDPVDGAVRYDGLIPIAVQPANGADLDVPAAAEEIKRSWTSGRTVELPVLSVQPPGHVSDAAIQRTVTEVARQAVAAPVKVLGEGRDGNLAPAAIAAAVTFGPDGFGGLKPVVDVPKLSETLKPQLAATEKPAKDAGVTLAGDRPVVTPSVDGHGVDYKATFAALPEVLPRADNREIKAVYGEQPAKLTTEQVSQLGIKGVISTFKTGGFAADSGVNIRRAAETINGKILKPGETFSLNNATGPRDAPQGYVPAGIIEHDRPAQGIGGGVSQLATTLYNASYFAGMTDVGHREHSYYISRYPVAREATVFEGAIDLKFRNDLPTGVLIQTIWTPADITVRFWGTKRYEVTSATSPKSNPTPPQTVSIPPGEKCSPSAGGEGFTATDTRTMRDLTTGQTKTSTHTVRYKPSPKVVCAGTPPPRN